MATVAVYNLKGGVGKTSIAVNFAWAAAMRGGRRTLIWDLDGQAAATAILAAGRAPGRAARDVLEGVASPLDAVIRTGVAGLDILPSDHSLHGLDLTFAAIGRDRHLADLLGGLARGYDCVVLDCPPGLGATSAQILRAATIVLLPMIPSSLSHRSLEEVQVHMLREREDAPPIVPVFNMADMRRAAHRRAIEAGPGYPIIPMASVVEMMADRNAPVGVYAPRSAAAVAFDGLWQAVEPHLE